MATGEIIRSYLIALGYKPNEEELKKFDTNIKRTEKVVNELGSSILKVGSVVSAEVEEMSRHLEDLYFVAQRSNAAAGNLMSLRYAADQVGVGNNAITSSIEGLRRSMNLNPGTEGLVQRLGVQTRDANNGLRDTTQIMNDLVGKLKEMGGPGTPGFAVASRYAQMLGMDPDTLLMLEKNFAQFKQDQDDYRQRVASAGLNQKDIFNQSHQFQRDLRKLSSDVEIFGQLMERDFIGPLDWFINTADSVVQGVNNADRAFGHWVSTLISIGSVWASWKAGIAAIRLIAPGLANRVFGEVAASAAGSGALGSRIIGTTLGVATRYAGPVAAFAYGMRPTAANQGEQGVLDRLGVTAKVQANDNAKVRGVVDFFVSKGWTRNQAIGIAANLMRESGFGAGAVGDSGKAYGLAQWHADRQARFKQLFGHDIHQSTMQEQLAFVDYELRHNEKAAGDKLRGASTPGEAAGLVTKYYERPRDVFGQSAISGKMADRIVNITNSTNVTVNGATDPRATSTAVGQEVNRSNGNLIRNLKSATQ